TKKFEGIKSRVDVTTGYSYNDFKTTNYNFLTLNADKDTISNSVMPAFPYDVPRYVMISALGRLLYNYDNRFFLTATIRRDGSSKFSENNRWGWFPSLGLA